MTKPKKTPVIEGTHLVIRGTEHIFRNITEFDIEICQKLNTIGLPTDKQKFSYRYKNKRDRHQRWTRWWTYPADQIIYEK